MENKKHYEMPDLSGEMGNAFAVMGYVKQILKETNNSHLIKGYLDRATSGNYANLIGESYLAIDYVNRKMKNKK